MLALSPQSDIRLLPESAISDRCKTRFMIDDVDLFYTTGYISELNRFFGMHLCQPRCSSPTTSISTLPRDTLLKEVLILEDELRQQISPD